MLKTRLLEVRIIQAPPQEPHKPPIRHHATTVFNRKMSLFDEDVQRFGAIRDYVVEHLLDDESPRRGECCGSFGF